MCGGVTTVTRLDQVSGVRSIRDQYPGSPQRELARLIVGKRAAYSISRNIALTVQSVYAIIRRHDKSRRAKQLAAA